MKRTIFSMFASLVFVASLQAQSTVVWRWGAPGDMPVSGDFDGDGRADVAVFRPSTGVWHILLASQDPISYAWGQSGDVPMPADYDGDGITDVAVYRPSQGAWFIALSSNRPTFDGFGYGAQLIGTASAFTIRVGAATSGGTVAFGSAKTRHCAASVGDANHVYTVAVGVLPTPDGRAVYLSAPMGQAFAAGSQVSVVCK